MAVAATGVRHFGGGSARASRGGQGTRAGCGHARKAARCTAPASMATAPAKADGVATIAPRRSGAQTVAGHRSDTGCALARRPGEMCACASGYHGDDCGETGPERPSRALGEPSASTPSYWLSAASATATTRCERSGCGSHGACDPAGSGACVCEEGWDGERCELVGCAPAADGEPSPCGEHGTCIDGLCRCELGFAAMAKGMPCEGVRDRLLGAAWHVRRRQVPV